MAATEALAGCRQLDLQPAHFEAATALVAEAGWNQVADDWAVMQRAGAAIGLVDPQDRLVATALALPYEGGRRSGQPAFGWISMVLVSGAMRRMGLATRLLQDRIAWLQARGLVAILDATEAGEKVYTPLGFRPGLRLSRWQGRGGAAAGDSRASLVREAGPDDRPRIAETDRLAFGADRGALLDAFLDRPGSRGFVGAGGFAILRHGRQAAQIGPLLATDEAGAIALLDAALAATDGPVFLDVLDARSHLVAHLQARGFTRQRGFLRMALGAMPDFDGMGRSMVIAGPEYG